MAEGDTSSQSIMDNKAGYNQSGKIIEILGQLRMTFVGAMMHNDYDQSIKTMKNIHNIIAAKVIEKDSEIIDELTIEIEGVLKFANETFVHNGVKYYKYPQARKDIENLINRFYRKLERLQDKYGYGMVTQDDPRMAVLQR